VISGAASPFADEHTVVAQAPAAVVWRALGESFPDSRVSRLYAAAVGARDTRPFGSPLVGGSTVPGFVVEEAVPPQRLVLVGRHRFSTYSLTFLLDEQGGSTRLTARTQASFPGVLGSLYRAAVIGSGGHRVLVRRWLRRIASAAEADTSS
jgi:hypothetical protein